MIAAARRAASHHRQVESVRAARADESGAVLILALAFLTVILVISLALINYSFTSVATTKAFRTERSLRYGADQALQASITNLQRSPQLGQKGATFVTGSTSTSGTFSMPIDQGPVSGDIRLPITNGSTLQVDWEVPADVASSGERQADGGQGAREVLFTVTCNLSGGATVRAPISCGGAGSGSVVVLARARVRYEIDYGVNGRTGQPIPPGSRAVVPKVLTWSNRIS